MNYKDLKGKTVFDFCNDAEILAKVAGYSTDSMKGLSKENILGYPYVVHAQMLQSLATEIKNNELYEAAKKYEDECWKELHKQSRETGRIID